VLDFSSPFPRGRCPFPDFPARLVKGRAPVLRRTRPVGSRCQRPSAWSARQVSDVAFVFHFVSSVAGRAHLVPPIFAAGVVSPAAPDSFCSRFLCPAREPLCPGQSLLGISVAGKGSGTGSNSSFSIRLLQLASNSRSGPVLGGEAPVEDFLFSICIFVCCR
jgi:hypothetical protein